MFNGGLGLFCWGLMFGILVLFDYVGFVDMDRFRVIVDLIVI